MTFGEYVKELRCKRDLSQRELAKLSDLSNAEISRLEKGERKNLSIKTLMKLANGLGIDDVELIKLCIDTINKERVGWKNYYLYY